MRQAIQHPSLQSDSLRGAFMGQLEVESEVYHAKKLSCQGRPSGTTSLGSLPESVSLSATARTSGRLRLAGGHLLRRSRLIPGGPDP